MKLRRGMGTIYQRGGVFWIKYYRNGKAYRESSGSDKKQKAADLLKQRLGEISTGRFIGPEAEKVTVRELAQDYLDDYLVNDKKSLDKAQRMVRRFDDEGKEIDSELMAYFGDCKAHNVTAAFVKRYVGKRKEESAANATINREMAALKRMFNLGIQASKIYRKPHIPMLKENNVRKGFFEHGDFTALRDAMPDYFKPVVTFAYYTGWRKQEILSLRWNQVDLNARTVRLDPGTTKSGAGRLVMLDGELFETVQGQWEKRKVAEIPGQSPTLLCTFVFHRNGKPLGDIRDVWAAGCKAANLTGKLFHDFRRTAVRNMVRAGVHERVVMQVSGHKTRNVFDRYNIVSEDDLKQASAKYSAHTQSLEAVSKVQAIR